MLRRTCGWMLVLACCFAAVGCASMGRSWGRKQFAGKSRCAGGQCQSGSCCNDVADPLSAPHDPEHQPVDSLDVLEGPTSIKPQAERPPLVPDRKQNPPQPDGIDAPVDRPVPVAEPDAESTRQPTKDDEDLSLPIRESDSAPAADRQAGARRSRTANSHSAGAIDWEVVEPGPMPAEQRAERRIPASAASARSAGETDGPDGADTLRIVRRGADALRGPAGRSSVARYNLLEKGNPLRSRAAAEQLADAPPADEPVRRITWEQAAAPESPAPQAAPFQARFSPPREVVPADCEIDPEVQAAVRPTVSHAARYAASPRRAATAIDEADPSRAKPAPRQIRPMRRPPAPIEPPASAASAVPADGTTYEPVDPPIDDSQDLEYQAHRVPPAPPRMRIVGPDFQELKPRGGGNR
jgi:hypothetical protein